MYSNGQQRNDLSEPNGDAGGEWRQRSLFVESGYRPELDERRDCNSQSAEHDGLYGEQHFGRHAYLEHGHCGGECESDGGGYQYYDMPGGERYRYGERRELVRVVAGYGFERDYGVGGCGIAYGFDYLYGYGDFSEWLYGYGGGGGGCERRAGCNGGPFGYDGLCAFVH